VTGYRGRGRTEPGADPVWEAWGRLSLAPGILPVFVSFGDQAAITLNGLEKMASNVANWLLALDSVFNHAVITRIGEPEGIASDLDTFRRGKFTGPFFWRTAAQNVN
jgi:hypothetical protein